MIRVRVSEMGLRERRRAKGVEAGREGSRRMRRKGEEGMVRTDERAAVAERGRGVVELGWEEVGAADRRQEISGRCRGGRGGGIGRGTERRRDVGLKEERGVTGRGSGRRRRRPLGGRLRDGREKQVSQRGDSEEGWRRRGKESIDPQGDREWLRLVSARRGFLEPQQVQQHRAHRRQPVAVSVPVR